MARAEDAGIFQQEKMSQQSAKTAAEQKRARRSDGENRQNVRTKGDAVKASENGPTKKMDKKKCGKPHETIIAIKQAVE